MLFFFLSVEPSTSAYLSSIAYNSTECFGCHYTCGIKYKKGTPDRLHLRLIFHTRHIINGNKRLGIQFVDEFH